MTEIFLDTAYAIALISESDDFHDRALALADYIEENQVYLVTTRAILLEIGNALSKLRYRTAAIQPLDALENDVSVEITPLSEQLYSEALQIYRERSDKEWGLIDCVSYLVMKKKVIYQVLTTDEHFRQVGFQVLMRDLPIDIKK
jgi:predicted nucleic acid-binding protein